MGGDPGPEGADTRAYREANRALWNRWTGHHVRSSFYDVEGFKAGRHRLDPVVLATVGDVDGKSLLHLQCHFGLDTLAWARLGARVTGVDFAGEAVAAARALALDCRLEAAFVESDVYDLPARLAGRFDVVFASHGVLGWLPDLDGWARVVAHFLAPGGRLALVDAHPFALMLDDSRGAAELRLAYPYFARPEPLRFERTGSYAVPDAPVTGVEYVWTHSLADILGSLLRAGLRLEAFEEYPFVRWAVVPWMEARPDGFWQLPAGAGDLPLMFSLRASAASPPIHPRGGARP